MPRHLPQIVHAARGLGKSYLMLALAAETCLQIPGARVPYILPTRAWAAKIVWPLVPIVYASAPDDVRPRIIQHEHMIRWPNGSFILIEGAGDDDGAHMRGPFAHRAVCDEGGFWDTLREPVHKILLPQVTRVDGTLTVISTSPESPAHDYKIMADEAAADGRYIRHTIDDNARLTPTQKQQLIEAIGGKQGLASSAVKRELYCEWVLDTDRAVIPESDLLQTVGDEYALPPYYYAFVGVDFGAVDGTHVLFAIVDFFAGKLIVLDEVVCHYETTSNLAAAIVRKERELGISEHVRQRVGDNDAQLLIDLSVDHGVHVSPADKHEKHAALNAVRQGIASGRIIVHERCRELIKQIKNGLWNKQRTDFERTPGLGHLDGIAALMYLFRHSDFSSNPYPKYWGSEPDNPFQIHLQTQSTHNKSQTLRSLIPGGKLGG